MTGQEGGQCSIALVRRLLLGLLGIGAVAALRRRRRAGDGNSPLQAPEADPRADELKRRLEEARAAAADRDEFEAAETPVDRVEAPVDERRRDVHDAAREEIERMREQP
jgi:hypothetical protein